MKYFFGKKSKTFLRYEKNAFRPVGFVREALYHPDRFLASLVSNIAEELENGSVPCEVKSAPVKPLVYFPANSADEYVSNINRYNAFTQLDLNEVGVRIVGMKVTKKKFVIYYETAGEKAGLCEKILQGVHGPWSFEPRIIYSYESSDRKMSMEDRAALVEKKKLKPDAKIIVGFDLVGHHLKDRRDLTALPIFPSF